MSVVHPRIRPLNGIKIHLARTCGPRLPQRKKGPRLQSLCRSPPVLPVDIWDNSVATATGQPSRSSATHGSRYTGCVPCALFRALRNPQGVDRSALPTRQQPASAGADCTVAPCTSRFPPAYPRTLSWSWCVCGVSVQVRAAREQTLRSAARWAAWAVRQWRRREAPQKPAVR
jgi:hypothetical protein